MVHHRAIRRAASAVIAVAAAALALPAGAFGAFTATPAGDVVTFVSDGASDTLVISHDGAGNLVHNQTAAPFDSTTDFDTTTAGTQTLPADDSIEIDVTGNGGEDTVIFFTVLVARGDLDGGDGDDTLGGTDGADTLVGGADDDRLVGFRGADDHDGGAGNDTMVWNNGDGSDTMDGDAGGGDVVEVNGSPSAGDAFTIAPGGGGRVDFDRTNLVPFSLDIGTVERLQVNGGPGDDTIQGAPGLAPLIALELNGGPGGDTVSGGDGPDLMAGGDDVDVLNGANGADRILGDRGNDAMNGQAGDDTLVWNNGDGTDRMDGGDDADRVEVNGAPAAGDAFTVAPVPGGARFDRTNFGLFGLDITTAELLDVRGLGGDDTFTVANGTPLGVTFSGNDGNDTFTGADGADTFLGGSGDDTGTGSGGTDVLDGQSGDDRAFARDGAADVVRCGDGSDTAESDLVTIDILVACESVDATQPPAALQPGSAPSITPPAVDDRAVAALVRTRTARLARNRRSFLMRLACPAAETGGCEVDLLVTTLNRVRVGGVRVRLVLATAEARLAAGQTRRVRVRVPRGILRLFRGRRTLTLRVTAETTDAAGNVAEVVRRVTLRRPRR